MQPVQKVYVPEEIKDEWRHVRPSEVCANQYSHYYHHRKLNKETEGWTVWIARGFVRNTLYVVQTGVAVVSKSVGITAAALFTRNEVPFRVVEEGATIAHEFYTASTRRPIEHVRIEAVVKKLGIIKTCSNPEAFIERVRAVYTKAYFASNGSYTLSGELAASNKSPQEKIDCMISYLKTPADKGFNQLLKHNGKKLFESIILLAENSVIS